MKNRFLRGFLPLITLLLLLNSCDAVNSLFNPDEENSSATITGTWNDGWGDTIITETLYDKGYYSGEIISINYGTLNADTSTDGLNNYGYFTVLYSGGNGDGKYGVVRWKSLTSYSVELSEGSNYPTNTYFDSESEAISGMDDSYFTYYGANTK